MGVSKVVYGTDTLVDLTEDTVVPEALAEGYTAHDASGNAIVGTFVSTDPGTAVGLLKRTTEGGQVEAAIAGVDYVAPPATSTELPASGTALTVNTIYTASGVGTYVFTPPESGWAHGTFTTGASVAVSFSGSFVGTAPTIEASKTYEFDVLNTVWAIQEVVTA